MNYQEYLARKASVDPATGLANVETLHPVAKLTQAYPKTFRGAGSTKASFAQRIDDELPLERTHSQG